MFRLAAPRAHDDRVWRGGDHRCTNIPDRPLMLRTGAPPTTKAHVAVFEGRPPYAYDALAFVRTCSFFVASRDALLEQAASVGADAIIEPAWNGENGQCLCGIAVRYRR
jgi:hypothetical protein